MSAAPFVTKGTRIRARWFQPKPLGTFSLPGFHWKTTGASVEIVGTCRHFRGDDPVSPTRVRVYVEPEGDVAEHVTRYRPYGCTCDGHDALVEINPDHIVEVLP